MLYVSEGLMSLFEILTPRKPTHSFVSIVKNYGQPACGSPAYSRQQTGYDNIVPKYHAQSFLWQLFMTTGVFPNAIKKTLLTTTCRVIASRG